jgi:hypothetical protein
MSVRIFEDMASKFDYVSVDAHHYLFVACVSPQHVFPGHPLGFYILDVDWSCMFSQVAVSYVQSNIKLVVLGL